MNYVNINGQEWMPPAASLNAPKPKKKEVSQEFHRGWKVEGLPPDPAPEARAHAAWAQKRDELAAKGREIGPFVAADWIDRLKLTPVRAKPYGVEGAAKECKALAERCGWTRVQIVEIKRSSAVA